jgi:hypothetical protein
LRDVRKSCESFEVVEGDPCRGGELGVGDEVACVGEVVESFFPRSVVSAVRSDDEPEVFGGSADVE